MNPKRITDPGEVMNRWFAAGKSVISQGMRRMLRPGYWDNLPPAGIDFLSAFVATSDGAQTCVPDGAGGYVWRALKDILTQAAADARYVNITGDTMTDQLTIRSAAEQLLTERYSADASGPAFRQRKSRHATLGSHTIVQSGDTVGNIAFQGSDGTTFVTAAQIVATIDGTPGTNDMPGKLSLRTTADGASTATERMSINAAGIVAIPDSNLRVVGSDDASKKLAIEVDTYIATATTRTHSPADHDGTPMLFIQRGDGMWFVDDFHSANTTSSAIGSLAWTTAFAGAGTITAQSLAATANHFGSVRLTTGTTDNGGTTLGLGSNATAGNLRIMEWMFQLSSTTSVAVFMGLFDGALTNGVLLEFDTDVPHTNWMATKLVGGVATKTSLGIAPAASVWWCLRIVETAVNSGAFDLTITRLDTGASGTVQHTGLTTSALVSSARAQHLTRNTTSKNLDIDYFGLYWQASSTGRA